MFSTPPSHTHTHTQTHLLSFYQLFCYIVVTWLSTVCPVPGLVLVCAVHSSHDGLRLQTVLPAACSHSCGGSRHRPATAQRGRVLLPDRYGQYGLKYNMEAKPAVETALFPTCLYSLQNCVFHFLCCDFFLCACKCKSWAQIHHRFPRILNLNLHGHWQLSVSIRV